MWIKVQSIEEENYKRIDKGEINLKEFRPSTKNKRGKK